MHNMVTHRKANATVAASLATNKADGELLHSQGATLDCMRVSTALSMSLHHTQSPKVKQVLHKTGTINTHDMPLP